MSSQIPGRHRAGQRINLGDHFAFEFGWTSFDNRDSGTGAPWVRVPIDLADGSAHVLHVECGNWGLLLPGRPLVDFDESRVNRFRIERRGDDYKFFNNGAFLASGTFAGYGPFVEFQLEVPVTSDGRGQMFTDFRLSRLP